MDPESHVPRFRWQTANDGEGRILDGEMPVGAFYAGADPLGYTARPVCLHDLRLIPGGDAFIARGEGCGALCLSWRKHLIFQPVIDELTVDDRDPQRLKLYVGSHDSGLRSDQSPDPPYQPGNVSEETWVELTYDPSLPSYVYDVRTRLLIAPGRAQNMFARDFGGLEFGDILPAGCNGRFPPRGDKRYQWYVYKGRDGRLYKLPHNHSRGPERRGILYAPDGFMAFLAEPECNPVVQFAGDSGLCVFSEICHAMYDVHFKFIRARQIELTEAGQPLEVRYRIHSVDGRAASEMLDQAVWDPRLERPEVRAPLYAEDGINRFGPSGEHLQPTDRWPWQASDPCCAWLWDTGHQSDGCLSIHRTDAEGASEWGCERAIEELRQFPQQRPFNGRYRVEAMVRTEGVSGRTRLGWAFFGTTAEGWWREREPEHSERELSGTNDWTPVSLVTSPGRAAVSARVFLEQEGAGRSWFGDVRISPVE